MKKEVQALIEKYNLKQKRLLLAVSGGVDSMVMLDLFIKEELQIAVAHLNHNLRPESETEAAFLKNYCTQKNIRFFTKKLNKPPKSEEEARTKRYDFLNSVMEKEKADFILTAHHLNDQIETLILKLTRGVGPVDLWGMREKRGQHLRPLLSIPKAEIYQYAKKNKLTFFEDKTNTDPKYARNLIRLNVIPELEKINPNFLKAARSTLELGQAQSELINSLSTKTLKSLQEDTHLNLSKFQSLNNFLKIEVLKKYLTNLTFQNTDRYRKNLEELLRVAQLKGNKTLKVGKVTLRKEYDKLGPVGAPKKMPAQKLKMGETRYNGFLIKLSKGKAVSGKNNILLPASLAYNLHVRTWRTGDKIQTVSGTKKLQDIFSDSKVSISDRHTWPIIEGEKEILWVPLLAKSKKHVKVATNETIKIEVIDERTTL